MPVACLENPARPVGRQSDQRSPSAWRLSSGSYGASGLRPVAYADGNSHCISQGAIVHGIESLRLALAAVRGEPVDRGRLCPMTEP
jgi:hypothetical protein